MSLLTHLNPNAIEDASIEGIKLKDGSITSSKIDSSVASKKYVDDTIASAISASDAMVFKGTIGTGGTSESLPSTAIVGDTYKVIALTTIPGASSYTGAEETAKVGDLIVAISGEPKWVVVPSGDDEIKTLVQSITWRDLKDKRDAGSLIPGMQYRITDYACTTTQSNTKSAGHQFDIIVVADDERTLNETARAIKHPVAEGETDYFANNDLSVWQIWYCIDNDTTRFAWADGTNGKGVIYRMIDEFNNDVPYDFKNIQFYRQWDSNTSLWSTISEDNTGVPCYTFSSDGDSSATEFTDMSLNKSNTYNTVYSNVIKGFTNPENGNLYLNNNCFFGEGCNCNIFGNGCENNTLGSDCYANTFGNNCCNNYFSGTCHNNTFGNGCENNTFKFGCENNTFGNNCCNNYFVGSWNNTFGGNCGNNTFGNNCCDNHFSENCHDNTFGKQCIYNTFGNGCQNNTFSENCVENTLGSGCQNIKFAPDSSAQMKNYYRNNHFGDGCMYIVFKGTEKATYSAQMQNYNFAQGLQGTSGTYLTIDGVRNRAFETKVAQNSNGELKIYCEADLIR